MRMRPRPSWWMAALLLVGPAAPVQPAPPSSPAEAVASGAVAARGCWSVEGGCVGRTGASAEPPLRGAVTEAWSWQVPDGGWTIAEEPRVRYDHVYVSVRRGPVAALHVLDLSDGRDVVPPLELETPSALEPCVGNEGIVVRSESDTLKLLRVVDGRWATAWSVKSPHGWVDSPMFHDGRLHARTARGFCSWEPGDSSSLRTIEGTYRGKPALHGERLWTVTYDDAGNGTLVPIDVVTGRVMGGTFVGHHGSKEPPEATWDTRIAAGRGLVLVQHGVGVKTAKGEAVRTSILLGERTGTELHDFHALPSIHESQWLGYGEDRGVTLLRLCQAAEPQGIRWWDLAGAKDRSEFYRPELPITITQGTAWVGTSAFELESRRVTCRLPYTRALFRPVPAWERLLVVHTADRLTAWRADRGAPEAPVALGAAFDGEKSVALAGGDGSALFRDGTALAGKLDLDPAAATVTVRPAKGKPLTRPLAEALVLVQGGDRLLYAASLTWLDRHLRRLAVLLDRERAAALVRDARAAKVAGLLDQVLYEALARGVPEKSLADARRDLETYLRTSPTPYESKAKTVQAGLQALRVPKGAQVLAQMASGLEDRRPDVQRALLRKVLELEPKHPAAVALVRASIPPDVKVTEPFVALDWVDVRAALTAVPTKPVVAPKEGERPLTPGERELGAARHYWRPDLVGIESSQLLVITSLNAPDRLAECLSLGELVATALEDMFAGGEHVRKNRWPMILQLFETAEEYRKFAVGGEPEESRTWSAGHYDPQAGMSRIYVPADDESLEDVRRTYAHELTHHWIQERCPLFEAKDLNGTAQDVNWIVEGMAVLVESFEWDVPGRRWTTFVPESQCLDLLAGAPDRASWAVFFDITDAQFQRLDRQNRYKLPLRNRLGYTLEVSDLNLFYATSGAVCTYLFHAGPKQRADLLAYVRDAYTGKVRAGTKHIEEHFGMSPEALGQAAVVWARDVTAGRLQKKGVFLK